MSKVTDHLGKEYENVRAMCDAYNISKQTYFARKSSGLTGSDLLAPLRRPQQNTICNGVEYRSVAALCCAYGISRKVFQSNLSKGLTIEEAVVKSGQVRKTGRGMPAVDHLGNEFKNVTAMCNHYNISIETYLPRIKSGMSIEDALTKKILRSGQRFDMTEVVKDHLGNEYDNMLEMCKAYGVSPEAYYARCKKGKTGEALLAPMKPRGKRIVVDGVEYESIREYCRVTGFPYKTYLSRVKKGCDTIAALQGLHRSEWGRAVTDHLGNNFVNTTAMCAFHGVSLGTYISRLRYGWSMEEALRKRETVEFNGVVYNSIRHLSMAFGVDDNTVRARLKRGWDLERALGLSSNNKVEYVDHFGNRFATLLEMVAAHGVSVNTYKYRINHGYNLEESLSAELKRGKYAPARKAKRNKIRNEIEKRRTQIEMLQNEILELEKSCQSSRDEVVDSSGIVYSTYREMCAAHSVSYNSFLARKRRGCSMAECLSNVRLNQKSK